VHEPLSELVRAGAYAAVCCSEVCCNVLQHVAVCEDEEFVVIAPLSLEGASVHEPLAALVRAGVCAAVGVAVCCSLLQCVAACFSVLHPKINHPKIRVVFHGCVFFVNVGK